MKRNQRYLAALISLGLLLGTTVPVHAFSTLVSQGGHIVLNIYDKGEESFDPQYAGKSTATLNAWQRSSLLYAANYWEQMLSKSFVGTPSYINIIYAGSTTKSTSVLYTSDLGSSTLLTTELFANEKKYHDFGTNPVGEMYLDLFSFPEGADPEYFYTPVPQLSQGTSTSLASTAYHEFGHLFGITSSTMQNIHAFSSAADAMAYDGHLYDYRGVQAKPGMKINSEPTAADLANDFTVFCICDAESPVGKKWSYFSGEHVLQVLDGAKLNVYDGNGALQTQDPVPGIPVLLDDLSHLELRNDAMSHQHFRNYFSFTEVELALLQDMGHTIDLRNYYGHSVYGNGLNLVNNNPYYARDAAGENYLTGQPNSTDFGVGLHVYGNENTIAQNADLLTNGKAAVGIRIDGYGNKLTVNGGTTVRADGENGNGILVAFGKNQDLTLAQGSTVAAAGTGGIGANFDFGVSSLGYYYGARGSYAARSLQKFQSASSVETDGPLVNTFQVYGALSGSKDAIHMANNALVKNVIIGTGAQLTGDITNEWLYDYDDVYAYGAATNATDTIPNAKPVKDIDKVFYRQYTGPEELTTSLAFANADGMSYSGNITGQKNTRLSFTAGATQYTGTAKVLSAEVAKDAALTGAGNFILATPADKDAHTLTYTLNPADAATTKKLTGVGIFTNKGLLAPTTGNIAITGDLISTGTLGASITDDQTSANAIQVSGSAALNGSTLTIVGATAPLLHKNYTYLTAQNGLTGTVTAAKISPYVLLTTGSDGTNAYFTTSQTQPLGSLSGQTASENSVGAALNKLALQAAATNPTSPQAKELNNLLFQNENTSRKFTTQVTSEARAQLLSQSPLSHLTSETVASRLATAAFSGEISANGTASLDANAPQVQTSLPVTLDAHENLWFKLFKGYETYNYAEDLKNQSFGGAIGYDKALNLTTRVGGLFSYGVTSYSTDNISGDSHDWRLGAYVDHKNGNWDYQGLLTYGHNNYDIDRSIGSDKVNGDYKAKVWDVEAKARYQLPSTARKTWQFTPYGKVSYTHTNQDAYGETGSSLYKQDLQSASNNSVRGELGLEFKRAYDKNGGFGGSVGYKRVISGLNPELNGTFAGDDNNFTIHSDNDRDFVTYSVNVHGKLAKNWTAQAELRGEASQNTHKEIISVAAKYAF